MRHDDRYKFLQEHRRNWAGLSFVDDYDDDVVDFVVVVLHTEGQKCDFVVLVTSAINLNLMVHDVSNSIKIASLSSSYLHLCKAGMHRSLGILHHTCS